MESFDNRNPFSTIIADCSVLVKTLEATDKVVTNSLSSGGEVVVFVSALATTIIFPQASIFIPPTPKRAPSKLLFFVKELFSTHN